MIKIREKLVPSSKYPLKSPHPMTPKYITIHNTANNATANNEITYMSHNLTQTSFHFAVDNLEAVQGIPLDRNAWHAGDGNGEGNRASIAIEICFSKSGGEKFRQAEINTAQLVAQLLKDRGWGIDRVKKHQDWSGKYCPHRTLDMGWQRFLNLISANTQSYPQVETANVDMSKSYLGKDGLQYIPQAKFKELVAKSTYWDQYGDGSVKTANVDMNNSKLDQNGLQGLPRAKFEELVAKSTKYDKLAKG